MEAHLTLLSSRDPSFLLLASWTGGGHFAAAGAISAALKAADGASSCCAIDVLQECAGFPFSFFPKVYAFLATRLPWLWWALWSATDSRFLADWLTVLGWLLAADRLRKLVQAHQPDVLVVLHPLLLRPAIRLRREFPWLRVACVVTDMVRLHAFWLHPEADQYFVPTELAARQALRSGVPAQRLVLSGQPIPSPLPASIGRRQAKGALGLCENVPLVVVTAGGAGLGLLGEVTASLAESGQCLQLAVICGRNETLRARLAGRSWPVPVRVLGFVQNMPVWLRAADVVVTKAGPNSLAEAMAEGLPTIIMGAVPGQETDNVSYLCGQGAAVWAPKPKLVGAAVARVLQEPEERHRLAERARAQARPEAAGIIASGLLSLVGARPLLAHDASHLEPSEESLAATAKPLVTAKDASLRSA